MPAPGSHDLTSDAAVSAAREAFASVLSRAVEAISVEASFFELGGNSLRAVALARRLLSETVLDSALRVFHLKDLSHTEKVFANIIIVMILN